MTASVKKLILRRVGGFGKQNPIVFFSAQSVLHREKV
jgi:hypothetical protein